ncbi:hypothetical protein [Acidovorax sp. sic0104]|uniref:hypothetical protein n=1 Tax=Acidovorax sp. sic0104 TaxID=2854784 RepID=UPI001C448B23|nr:hypothetical protein [Acidovorax sp. sic0104]MBV7541943.1 hypothetical protein [Acidovorax sp. sic0104]
MSEETKTLPRVMSATERWSARIVAASRAGVMVGYADVAERVLNGGTVPEDVATSLCREAAALNHRLCDDEGAVHEANEILAAVLDEFGLSEV